MLDLAKLNSFTFNSSSSQIFHIFQGSTKGASTKNFHHASRILAVKGVEGGGEG